MKKIALIFNCNNEGNYQLTMLGQTQVGYFIQLALGWFGKTTMLENLNGIVVFATERANDLEPAMLVQNCNDMNYVIPLELVNRMWGTYGDDLPNGETKSGSLAKDIDEFDRRDCAIVFAWFSLDYNVEPFLNHWGIPKPETWPKVDVPALVRIDIESKTIEFESAPFPARAE